MTKKELQRIAKHTKPELVDTACSIVETLGVFTPAGANWSYVAGWTFEGDLVVTRFGHIVKTV